MCSPLSSPLCSILGRRRTMMVACGPMFLGWTLITYAQNSAMILAGRASCAAASAVAIPASYTYVAEIARHTFACCL